MKYTSIILLLSLLLFSACQIPEGQRSTDAQVARQTEQLMTESNKTVGMPNIVNWNEKKLVRDLYELRDTEDLLTYTYIINLEGDRIFLGRSIGFGIPASVQFSNPQRAVDYEKELGYNVFEEPVGNMPQPEPNGLFMPEGLSATWVFLLDGEGTPRPVYVEPQIMVSPFKLH